MVPKFGNNVRNLIVWTIIIWSTVAAAGITFFQRVNPKAAAQAITTIGSTSTTAATNTVVITLTQGAAIGSIVVVAAAGGENVNPTTADSKSNLWTRIVEIDGGGGSSPSASIHFSKISSALVSGDTITVTFNASSNGIARGAVAFIANGMTSVDQFGSLQAGSNTTTVSATTSGAVTSATELIVGVTAENCNSTITPAAGFDEIQENQGSVSWSIAVKTGTGLSGTQSFTGTAGTGCRWGTVVATFHAVTPVAPSALSLSQTNRNKNFTVSWTGGAGNNGANGCELQYLRSDASWQNLGTYNCDANAASQAATLPSTANWYLTNWSSVQVRLLRVSDSTVLGTFGTNLTCSVTAANAAINNLDENCNGTWDDLNSCSSYAWAYVQTFNSSYTACTNTTTHATLACTVGIKDELHYTNGTGTGSTPASIWSSIMYGVGCTGSYTGAVEWRCTGSGCTYF